jgi:ubiquinone biosynthesis UbiH/UbiF/VisC/COQ6 family hydroxylase
LLCPRRKISGVRAWFYNGISMRKRDQFEVVIVGGGLVGAAFAAALADAPLEVALIEARGPQPIVPEDGNWDARVYAVSPASARFLGGLGVWGDVANERLTAIHRMQVFGDGGGAAITFDAFATGVPELAWIVESRLLHAALWRKLQQQKNLRLLCPAECTALALDDGHARLTLADGARISSQLVVGADGPHSWLRGAAGISATDKPYAQLGVVANFASEREHAGTAYQWFRPEGTLAYLPLPGRRISIVWAAREAFARELLALPADQLTQRVEDAGQHVLGKLELLTPAQAFPLRLLTVPASVAPGLALIGDAAHVVHPLAGQGVNLGFADAHALAATLIAREPFRGCGDSRLLRRYERARREQHFALQCVTHGLQRLFSSESSVLRHARNRGLELADALPVLKNLLAHRALGSW